MACREGVAREAWQARAGRRMVDDRALRVGTTHARTRVGTLVIDTGSTARTVSVEHTLGSAAGVRVTRVVGQAGARAGAITLSTHSVGTTRSRVARITRSLWLSRYNQHSSSKSLVIVN